MGIMTFSILIVLDFLNRQALPSNLVATVLSLKFMGLEGPWNQNELNLIFPIFSASTQLLPNLILKFKDMYFLLAIVYTMPMYRA